MDIAAWPTYWIARIASSESFTAISILFQSSIPSSPAFIAVRKTVTALKDLAEARFGATSRKMSPKRVLAALSICLPLFKQPENRRHHLVSGNFNPELLCISGYGPALGFDLRWAAV